MTEHPQRGREEDDLWAWIDQDDFSSDAPEIDPASVLAVMVVRDAAEWLPRQLLSLAGLSPRPGRLVAVDAGSTDHSRELLSRALDEGVLDEVLDAEGRFGQAVAHAVGESNPEWLWLLHDDSAPRRNALAHLLEGARHADVVVPKLLEPKRRNYPETISELGQAITAGGVRVPLVEEGEIDQRQHDARDVLGASTAGLLIRGDAWREVGGIAAEVARHRDGVDLCWRINAVGYRVLAWPAAALTHRRAGRTGERPGDRHPHEDDRLAALRVAGSRGASRFGLGAASVARAAGFLLGKSPSHAAAELRAVRRFNATQDQTRALAARLPEEDLTPEELLPSRFWPVRHAVDRFGSGLSERYRDLTDREADTSIDELTGDDFAGVQRRRRLISPITAMVVVLFLAAVLAGRTLLGFGTVSGGGLLPAPATFASAWQAYLTGEAPWLGFAAAATVVAVGSPGWFAFFGLLVTPLLSGLAALALLRRLDVAPTLAAAASGAWAGAVLLLGLVTAGDLTGMVLGIVGPLLARAVHSLARDGSGGAEALRAPAGVAFWLLVGASFWPALLLAATVAAVAWAARDRSRLVPAAVAVLPSWLFLAPWLPELVRHPGRWLTGADPMAWPDYPPASFAMVLGRILPSGLPLWANVAFFAILGLLAALHLARLSRQSWLWSVVAIGVPLLVGTLLSRFVVAVDGGSVRPLLSPWALMVVAALLAPVLFVERGERPRRPVVAALAAAALLAVGTWAAVGFGGPVRNQEPVLPGYVRDVVASPRDSRALMIELDDRGDLRWNVVDQRQPRWGSGERHLAGSFPDELYLLVQAFASGNPPETLAEDLRRLGVSHVWLRGFGPDRRASLDNAAGLTSAAADDVTVVYTVVGLVSRAYVMEADGPTPLVDGRVGESPEDGRWIELAEPEDAAWTAELDGRGLERWTGTGRLGFHVGPEAGEVTIEPTPRWWQLVLHLGVLAALALLAAPSMGGPAVARRGRP